MTASIQNNRLVFNNVNERIFGKQKKGIAILKGAMAKIQLKLGFAEKVTVDGKAVVINKHSRNNWIARTTNGSTVTNISRFSKTHRVIDKAVRELVEEENNGINSTIKMLSTHAKAQKIGMNKESSSFFNASTTKSFFNKEVKVLANSLSYLRDIIAFKKNGLKEVKTKNISNIRNEIRQFNIGSLKSIARPNTDLNISKLEFLMANHFETVSKHFEKMPDNNMKKAILAANEAYNKLAASSERTSPDVNIIIGQLKRALEENNISLKDLAGEKAISAPAYHLATCLLNSKYKFSKIGKYLENAKLLRTYKAKVASENEKAATKIQAAFREFKARKELKAQKQAAAKTQATFREFKARKELKAQKQAAAKIQATFRGFIARKELKTQKQAATKIQAAFREFKAKEDSAYIAKHADALEKFRTSLIDLAKQQFGDNTLARDYTQKSFKQAVESKYTLISLEEFVRNEEARIAREQKQVEEEVSSPPSLISRVGTFTWSLLQAGS